MAVYIVVDLISLGMRSCFVFNWLNRELKAFSINHTDYIINLSGLLRPISDETESKPMNYIIYLNNAINYLMADLIKIT